MSDLYKTFALSKIKSWKLSEKSYDQLTAELKRTGDPRATGQDIDFDAFPYLGGAPKFPGKRR